jgi:hypothetical protein
MKPLQDEITQTQETIGKIAEATIEGFTQQDTQFSRQRVYNLFFIIWLIIITILAIVK